MSLLESIKHPGEIKKYTLDQLKELAREIRQVILDTVLTNGGHLASSLGVVEVIIAMHYVFDAPLDKFIFDVGHQCYAHKLLTGRLKEFNTLRIMGGLAGFPKRSESEFDTVNTGHSSTSLSTACGITRAMTLSGDAKHTTVSLIGDGALTGGLAYEALNDINELKQKQVILLNDNAMSISQNVGSTAKYLLKLHGNDLYQRIKNGAVNFVNALDVTAGNKPFGFIYKAKNSVKYFLQGGMPFEQFGIRYFGPIDGHNLEQLIKAFEIAKDEDTSVMIHILTKKGRGFKEAEDNPAKYHGYSGGGGGGESFSSVFGQSMVSLRDSNDKVFAITAAMGDGVGLTDYEAKYPESFADIGIAEGHAITMASGLAIMGYKPYFAVYSSFLQRGYDGLVHDVCMQNLPVTICIDRAGLVPGDGETHQGIYDVSFMRCLPNLTIVAPRCSKELEKFMEWSLTFDAPLAIRYPKGESFGAGEDMEIVLGKWQVLSQGKCNIVILAMGARMCEEAINAEGILRDAKISVTLVNCCFVKPLDNDYLDTLGGKVVYTLEDNMIAGGFGSAVMEYLNKKKINANVTMLGVDDQALEHASISQLLDMLGLSAAKIAARIIEDKQ